MKASSVGNKLINFKGKDLRLDGKRNINGNVISNYSYAPVNNSPKAVSFGSHLSLSKKMLLKFRNLSEYMQEASEMTNALIAMIGTGVIAPFAIMCSPNKKCNKSPEDKKVDREKKFFQAIRQPISAFLAFAFQVPTTVGVAMGFNHLAYKKHLKIFDDETLGTLIPNKKYLKSQAKKALREDASPRLKAEWAEELKKVKDENAVTTELMERIRQDYRDVNVNISEEELRKLAADPKRRANFIVEKMAKDKHERLIDAKVQQLSAKNLEIKDLDIVTEKYQKLAKEERFKADFEQLRKNANLSPLDKFLKAMGFSNKKLSALEKEEKALAKEKGLILMKEDVPEFFADGVSKLRKFVKNKDKAAQKLYANKIFWLSLVTNLFMVAISCTALNWLHPKFADFIDSIRGKRPHPKTSDNKKAEVNNK